MSNKIEIRISGLGGQGVVLAGKILGTAAVYDGKNAVQTQSYGAEARGSATKSEVIISQDEIRFPAVRKCDILVAMSQEALEKNINDLKEGGIILIDTTTVKNIPEINAKIFRIPATEMAEKFYGQKLYANMIMLGVLIGITNILSEESLKRAIKDTISNKTAIINLKAYKKGKEFRRKII